MRNRLNTIVTFLFCFTRKVPTKTLRFVCRRNAEIVYPQFVTQRQKFIRRPWASLYFVSSTSQKKCIALSHTWIPKPKIIYNDTCNAKKNINKIKDKLFSHTIAYTSSFVGMYFAVFYYLPDRMTYLTLSCIKYANKNFLMFFFFL